MNLFRDHVVKSVKPRGSGRSDRTGLLSKTLLNINWSRSVSHGSLAACVRHMIPPPAPHRSPEVHPRWIFHSCWLTVCTFISWLIYSKFPFVVLVISVACKRTLVFPQRGEIHLTADMLFFGWNQPFIITWSEVFIHVSFVSSAWVCGKHTIILRVLVARGAGAEITEKLSRFV